MKKSTKRRITRLLALTLTLFMLALPLFSVFADGTPVSERAYGLSDFKVYSLQNKASGLYLTPPDYTEVNDPINPTCNVFQQAKGVYNQYSRAFTIIYSENNGLYTISSVLFETFGEARVTYNSATDNVYLTDNSNEGVAEWKFIYNEQQGGYRILNENCEAITASGYGTGNSSQTVATENGNIYVTSEQCGNYQIWILEEVTPIPHLVKPIDTIEKKNIGTGREWLFKLRDSEIGIRTILNVEAEQNSSVVTIANNNNGFIVKINESDGTETDPYSKFALIKITLDSDEVRYVMVQDAGTGNGDACRTIPINKLSRCYSVTLSDNEMYHQYLITLGSELGGAKVVQWSLNGNYNIRFATSSEDNILTGSSYALIKAYTEGYTIISAFVDHDSNSSTDPIEYKVVVEVKRHIKLNDGSDSVRNAIEVVNYDSSTESIVLNHSTRYLMNFDSYVRNTSINSNEDFAALWRVDYSDTITVVEGGLNYVIIQTSDLSVFEVYDEVTGEQYKENGVTVPLEYGSLRADFMIKKPSKLYLLDGEYFIQNVKYNSKFLQSDNASADAFMEIWDFDGEEDQQWEFEYLDNGYYYITSVESGYFLTIADDVMYDENARIRQDIFDRNSEYLPEKYQWRITYNSGGGYTIQNRSTYENTSTQTYSVSNGPALVEGQNGNNVLNRAPQTDRSDEWLILTVDLPVRFGEDFFGVNHTDSNIEIAYWYKNNIKLAVEIDDTYFVEGSGVTNEDIERALQNAISEWNRVLGVNIEITTNKADADITMIFSSKVYYTGVYGIISTNGQESGIDGVSEEYIDEKIYSKEYSDGEKYHEIKIFERSSARIGIFDIVPYTLNRTIIHELGHALGYDGHSTNSGSVMYHRVTSACFNWEPLTEEAVSVLATVYKESHLIG